MAEEFNKYKRNTLNTEYIEDKFSSSGGALCELVHIDDSNIKEVWYQQKSKCKEYYVVVDCPNVFLAITISPSTNTASYTGLADLMRAMVADQMETSGELNSTIAEVVKLFPFQYWPDTFDEYSNSKLDCRLDYLGNLVRYNGVDDYNSKDKIASISSKISESSNLIKYEGPFDFSLIGGAFYCWTYPAAYKKMGSINPGIA